MSCLGPGRQTLVVDERLRRMNGHLAQRFRLVVLDRCSGGRSAAADEMEAALDAAGATQAWIFGLGAGGMAGIEFAATRRERTTGLLLFGTPAAMDMRHQLLRVNAPTLVMQRQSDPTVPPDAGRVLAYGIPRGELALLPGDDPRPWHGDTAAVLAAIDGFVDRTTVQAQRVAGSHRSGRMAPGTNSAPGGHQRRRLPVMC